VRDSLISFFAIDSFGWRDALDILLVAVLVYGVVALLRRTRGMPVAVGIVAFIILWRAALALELQTLGTILDLSLAMLPFAIVLLFQNHIRRALMTLGRNPLFRLFAPSEERMVIENLALAALSLQSQRLGAIIAIEREVGLRTFIESGVAVDARPSYELFMALFHPRSPLHDGAVIVAQGRVAAASCLLPLTTRPVLSGKVGSRHRAALGLSEETDALVIVVSEERGVISVVRDGEIQVLEARELRDVLLRELGPATLPAPRPAAARA
jgi:uncharacterized protein (TIGR00159 family)